MQCPAASLRKAGTVVSGSEPEPDAIDRKSILLSVSAAQHGDVDAFERLYRHFAGFVYGLCLRMLASPADAEDCVQQTFTKAWTQLNRFEGRSEFGTWLHRIAVNEALMAERRNRRFELVEVRDEMAVETGCPAAAIDIEQAVADLPVRRRHVFVLKAVYGYSHDEIAGLLDISSGTSRAQFYQARQTLMNVLGQEKQHERR